MSSCCCWLHIHVSGLKHLDAFFSESKPLIELWNHHGPVVRLRLKFLSFFKGALLPNFNKMVEHEIEIVEVQQLEDIFSIVCTYRFAHLA